jgi:hypothetical protein
VYFEIAFCVSENEGSNFLTHDPTADSVFKKPAVAPGKNYAAVSSNDMRYMS